MNIKDLKSASYGIPDIIKDMSCTECGEVPPWTYKSTIMGVDVNVNYINWIVTYKENDIDYNKPILCPLCVRRLKIEKIKQSL